MIFINKQLRFFLDLLVSFFLLPFNLLIIFRNRKLLSKYNHTVIQTVGGYGHTFTTVDLSRIFFSNNFLYIRFFEESRHNFFIPELFVKNYLTIRNSLFIKYFNKPISIGEIESSKTKVVRKILINFIRLFARGNILIDHDIYRYGEKKYPNKINKTINDKSHYWVSVYYYLQKKNKFILNLNLFEKFLIRNNFKEITQLRKNKKKNVTIYLRKKQSTDLFSNIRNGSEKSEYLPALKYLVKKKMNIFLTGDDIFNRDDLERMGGNIVDCNFFKGKLKSILRIYLNCISNFYIAENGGAKFFGLYAKKFLLINSFPPESLDNRIARQTKILPKKFFNKNTKKYFSPSKKYIKLRV